MEKKQTRGHLICLCFTLFRGEKSLFFNLWCCNNMSLWKEANEPKRLFEGKNKNSCTTCLIFSLSPWQSVSVSLDDVIGSFCRKAWELLNVLQLPRGPCRKSWPICLLLSSNPHQASSLCVRHHISQLPFVLSISLSFRRGKEKKNTIKKLQEADYCFIDTAGLEIVSFSPPSLDTELTLRTLWSDGNDPAGNGKDIAICHLKMSARLFLFFFILAFFTPRPNDSKKAILRNLESWFTARPCHLNQVSQWNETKVQHQPEPRERAEPSGGWQLSFSARDLGGGPLHCSPASSVLL